MAYLFESEVRGRRFVYLGESYRDVFGRPRNRRCRVGIVCPEQGVRIFRKEFLTAKSIQDIRIPPEFQEKALREMAEVELKHPELVNSYEEWESYKKVVKKRMNSVFFTAEDIRKTSTISAGLFTVHNHFSQRIGLKEALKIGFGEDKRELLALSSFLSASDGDLSLLPKWSESRECFCEDLSLELISQIPESLKVGKVEDFYRIFNQGFNDLSHGVFVLNDDAEKREREILGPYPDVWGRTFLVTGSNTGVAKLFNLNPDIVIGVYQGKESGLEAQGEAQGEAQEAEKEEDRKGDQEGIKEDSGESERGVPHDSPKVSPKVSLKTPPKTSFETKNPHGTAGDILADFYMRSFVVVETLEDPFLTPEAIHEYFSFKRFAAEISVLAPFVKEAVLELERSPVISPIVPKKARADGKRILLRKEYLSKLEPDKESEEKEKSWTGLEEESETLNEIKPKTWSGFEAGPGYTSRFVLYVEELLQEETLAADKAEEEEDKAFKDGRLFQSEPPSPSFGKEEGEKEKPRVQKLRAFVCDPLTSYDQAVKYLSERSYLEGAYHKAKDRLSALSLNSEPKSVQAGMAFIIFLSLMFSETMFTACYSVPSLRDKSVASVIAELEGLFRYIVKGVTFIDELSPFQREAFLALGFSETEINDLENSLERI
jgi:hypothetical protein